MFYLFTSFQTLPVYAIFCLKIKAKIRQMVVLENKPQIPNQRESSRVLSFLFFFKFQGILSKFLTLSTLLKLAGVYRKL